MYPHAKQVGVDPTSVKGHRAIISHHVLTAIYLIIPWFHPKYADLMAINMLVEVRSGPDVLSHTY